ncbi:MAG: hypothetical protein JO168_12910 [Solirubrobacterales bacterium]|nr:hypothetical protein [Solirubrobacterales bacterium]MBV9717145.1 hypothetical protein [Solirubrobacterales bacterium]
MGEQAQGNREQVEAAYVELPDPALIAASRPADHPYNFGSPTGMSRLLMAHPRIGPAFLGLFSQIMFEPGALSRQEREFVAAVTASVQNCFY